MTNVLIGRELLERVCHRDNSTRQLARRELRTILTQTAPEVEAVEVVGFSWLSTAHFRRTIPNHVDQAGHALWQPLMTIAQHTRIVAALQARAVDPLEWSRKHGIEEY